MKPGPSFFHYPVLFYVLFISSCKNFPAFEAGEFVPMKNLPASACESLKAERFTRNDSSITIPSPGQVAGGYFIFSFDIKNNSDRDKKFLYKIFYRAENTDGPDDFYGSWENTEQEFKATGFISPDGNYYPVLDSFRIIGNPRNEKKYYGPAWEGTPIPDSLVTRTVERIKKDTVWLSGVRSRAGKEGLEQRLLAEARYVLEQEGKNKIINKRWRRNPPAGTYSFLLVVADSAAAANTDPSASDISLKKGNGYTDPFDYFLNGEGSRLKGISVRLSSEKLRIRMADPQ